MGTSRRTILSILTFILPAAALTSVGAEASTHVHSHHAKSVTIAKSSHHTTHKTAALHTHGKPHTTG